MRKTYIITTLLLVIANISCKAQFIVPIEEHKAYIENIDNSDDEVPENTYYKDVNNLLDPYEGTWTGSFESSTIEITIEKITTTSAYGKMRDRLFIRHKVLNNSIEIANTLNLPNDSPKVMKGIYFDEQGNYQVSYIYNLDCGQNGVVFVKLKSNPNELAFSMTPAGEVNIDPTVCGTPEQILPTSRITLTRQ